MKVLCSFSYEQSFAELTGGELEMLEKMMNKFVKVDYRHVESGGYEYLTKARQEQFKCEILPAATKLIPFEVHSAAE